MMRKRVKAAFKRRVEGRESFGNIGIGEPPIVSGLFTLFSLSLFALRKVFVETINAHSPTLAQQLPETAMSTYTQTLYQIVFSTKHQFKGCIQAKLRFNMV
jgi:hypothetical protein